MDEHALKQKLQNLFSDGLVTIVGSGLSCAEGLPGMADLAQMLIKTMPGNVATEDKVAWDNVSDLLKAGQGLEAALQEVEISPSLTDAIVRATAEFILANEGRALADCLQTHRTLRFARLLRHLSPTSPKFVEVITPNYDRLIEFAVESAGWGVDTGFIGRLLGQHSPVASDKSFIRGIVQHGKTTKLLYRDRVRLYKPHGSLDWFNTTKGAISSSLPIAAKRLIITPGVGKYKYGYEQPFDSHREGANAAIDKANGILCIGYGFNDYHLQTHLTPRLKDGVPAILLSYELTQAAAAVVQASPNGIALIHHSKGTEVVTCVGRDVVSGENWWDLEHFIEGVLEP